jgi:uncharacterized protein
MKNDFVPQHLNVESFAKAAGRNVGDERLARFGRLLEETQGVGAESPVSYSARGEVLHEGDAAEEVWLHLAAQAVLPLTCQRCLGPVELAVSFDRSFRFVATEEIAAALDEECEEDVLVTEKDFNLLSLIEDELLMALPVVAKHEVCPIPVQLHVADADFVDEPVEKPNPFAVLQQLKKNSKPE